MTHLITDGLPIINCDFPWKFPSKTRISQPTPHPPGICRAFHGHIHRLQRLRCSEAGRPRSRLCGGQVVLPKFMVVLMVIDGSYGFIVVNSE